MSGAIDLVKMAVTSPQFTAGSFMRNSSTRTGYILVGFIGSVFVIVASFAPNSPAPIFAVLGIIASSWFGAGISAHLILAGQEPQELNENEQP